MNDIVAQQADIARKKQGLAILIDMLVSRHIVQKVQLTLRAQLLSGISTPAEYVSSFNSVTEYWKNKELKGNSFVPKPIIRLSA